MARLSNTSIMLLAGVGVTAIAAPAAAAQTRTFDIPAAVATKSVPEFARQAGIQIIAPGARLRGITTPAIKGVMDTRVALRRLLGGSGLNVVADDGGTITLGAATAVSQAAPPAAQDEPASTADIVVTAQKRPERIQDIPIAISAFSGKTLDAMKIETGGDLLKSIPNVTFSKNNFAGYNFSIRGIGTKAVAASTDPGVAVAFNSSNIIVNRLFEQEFYDIERVEVLRGPQGTLYGRNATAGVVNIISQKAKLDKFEGFAKLETGNYATRRASGAINIPLFTDQLALRVAGAYTKRDGFAKNDFYGKRIDGRDLWSTRVTLSGHPNDKIALDLIWEHFNEDDDRQRTGKQLCNTDPGPASIGGVPLQNANATLSTYRPEYSQGCRDGSLYDDAAFGTPNGRSLNAISVLYSLSNGAISAPLPREANGDQLDPYAGVVQSRNLRRFSAIINPRYKAKADVFEANVSLDIGSSIIISQTLYNRDRYYSTQDYSRYVSRPIFPRQEQGIYPDIRYAIDGVFDDPQLGPSDRFLAGDLIRTRSSQISQEVRLQSNDATSPIQYVIGGNYTKLKLNADYNVFINTLTYLAQGADTYFNFAQSDTCYAPNGKSGPGKFVPGCIYTDANPLGRGPQDGHNYFRSINPYHLTSWGLFGDVNLAVSPHLKIIAGLRSNHDHKDFDVVPSQLLLGTGTGNGFFGYPVGLAGFVDRGYPTVNVIGQSWSKVTGRAGLQWTPDLSFTDKSLVYATYSRGYKAGGANPPGPGFGTAAGGYGAGTSAVGQTLDPTFRPEYVNSFEAGVKNTLFNGAMTLNATGFFYDYKDYQVSQIIDRSSQNENFDATIWGLEFETVVNPTRNLAINANLGYERSRIKSGQRSIDVMDRTQGRDGYYLVKPFAQLPSNCVVSEAVILKSIQFVTNAGTGVDKLGYSICQGSGFSDVRLADLSNYPTGITLDQLYPNGGRGFYAPLGGNELPNTPHLTANLGVQYTIPIGNDWGVIARGDVYHQSESWARVYNDRIDRLHSWENVNASLRVGNERYKFLAEVYVKNVFNASPITDAFINSDDTGLTTNVFTLDPRTIGISITKGF